MSTATPSIPAFGPASLPMPAAALEVLGYLTVVGVGTLCFLLGWLSPNGAVVLTVLLLSTLIVLAWNRFDQGRHPCFLFLCTLMFFQGGKLLTYCFGAQDSPLRVRVLTYYAFDISRSDAGIVLLSLALSAICIYAPCRWRYHRLISSDDRHTRRYLPYLYLLFYGSLPIQLFKNYRYYEYVQEHGGYVAIFLSHGNLASSVPFLVRIIPLISLSTFIAIFTFEHRKKYLYTAAILYFGTASLILLLGSRLAIFALLLTLWYVARLKSTKKPRILRLLVIALVLMVVADVIQTVREDSTAISDYSFLPAEFLALQGNSLDVAEVAVTQRKLFAPYATSYLWHELQNAFVASDVRNYFRGQALSSDVSVFLNAPLFAQGHGSGASYLAEAYVIGGLAGVVLISLMIGCLLHFLYRFSRHPLSLFIVAMILPDVLSMPRQQLLDWVSVLLRSAVSILLLLAGWQLYKLLFSIRQTGACDEVGAAT